MFMVTSVRFKTENLQYFLLLYSWKMHSTTFLKTWWRVKTERKKQPRYIFDSCEMEKICLTVAGYFIVCGETSLLSFSGGGHPSAAPPEAGAVLDACSRKQTYAAALLGEERRALLQQTHVFLCQRNAREGLRGNTGGRHGAGESYGSTRLSLERILVNTNMTHSPGEDSDHHRTHPHQLPQWKPSACGDVCKCSRTVLCLPLPTD